MRSYKFLLKPAFFIFNLLFATWLVIRIEKIKPSDLGGYEHLFENGNNVSMESQKNALKALFKTYQYEKTDSMAFDKKIEEVIRLIKQ